MIVTIGGVDYPAVWAICDRCRGNGTHVNPSIDGNGISTEDEIWQDDDFREMYFSGGYDVKCEANCQDGKILVPNRAMLTQAQIDEIDEWHQQEREYRHECEMERRMGA